MENCRIMGVYVENREREACRVQEILTSRGCSIRTRLGIHDAGDAGCSLSGIIILELCGSDEDIEKLSEELRSVEGVRVGRMVFD